MKAANRSLAYLFGAAAAAVVPIGDAGKALGQFDGDLWFDVHTQFGWQIFLRAEGWGPAGPEYSHVSARILEPQFVDASITPLPGPDQESLYIGDLLEEACPDDPFTVEAWSDVEALIGGGQGWQTVHGPIWEESTFYCPFAC